jgi:hypothetical protein
MVTITKTRRATHHGSGRGMDNTGTGAAYVIAQDGQAVGCILPNARRPYAPAEWDVIAYTLDASGAVIGRTPLRQFDGYFDPQPFRKAKDFALAYFGNEKEEA